ncbi:MAG: M48 family metallopeptidase [Micromonosporaceae bacterium]|nr:M48 family metallopeptidase [Micromonosporaceae bacterium]
MSPRWWAVLTLVALAGGLAVAALSRIPWRRLPAPRPDQLAALAGLPADQVRRARAFRSRLRPANYGSMVVGLAVALVLGFSPAGAALVAACARPVGDQWIARAVLGGLAVVFLSALLTVPFAAWRHAVNKQFGLSTQGWGGWAVDVLKGYALLAVLGGAALLGFYAVTRATPRWWWAYGAAGAAALMVLLSFVFPVLFEPIFNKFAPMPDSQLRTELLALAARDGVPVRDVLVADASRRTRAVNAYVSGFGATRRIVVYDTLLREASPAEVVSVAAHELAHARYGDVVTGTLLGALGAASAVIATYLIGFWSGLLRLAGVDSVAEPRSIALLLALASLAGVVAGPVQNLVSRRIEAHADGHALALTADPATFEAMQTRLSMVNLGDPDPNRWEHLLFASHPSTVERIAAARAYARAAPQAGQDAG